MPGGRKLAKGFIVDETPYCLWDDDIEARNLELLTKIDPGYFDFIRDESARILDDVDACEDSRQHAAIAIRIAYGQALETLFALLGAALQAPHCVVGWLLKYRQTDLNSIAAKLNAGQNVPTLWDSNPSSWRGVARIIFEGVEDRFEELTEDFGGLWESLAHDFMDETTSDEYNSLKHGFRVQPGGFHLRIEVPNTEHRIESDSEFGLSYFVSEKIKQDNATNFIIHEQSNNWYPDSYAYALDTVTFSMRNVITFLKTFNGFDGDDLQMVYPDDRAAFTSPWEHRKVGSGVVRLRRNSLINVAGVQCATKDQIRDRYGIKS